MPEGAGGSASPMYVYADCVELLDLWRTMENVILTMNVPLGGAWEDQGSTVMAAVNRRCSMELTAVDGVIYNVSQASASVTSAGHRETDRYL